MFKKVTVAALMLLMSAPDLICRITDQLPEDSKVRQECQECVSFFSFLKPLSPKEQQCKKLNNEVIPKTKEALRDLHQKINSGNSTVDKNVELIKIIQSLHPFVSPIVSDDEGVANSETMKIFSLLAEELGSENGETDNQ